MKAGAVAFTQYGLDVLTSYVLPTILADDGCILREISPKQCLAQNSQHVFGCEPGKDLLGKDLLLTRRGIGVACACSWKPEDEPGNGHGNERQRTTTRGWAGCALIFPSPSAAGLPLNTRSPI